VERKVGQADPYLPLARLAPNAVTYVDTSVQMGVTYCYRIRAFRAASYSEPSNDVCATPKPSTSPGTGR